MKIYCENCKYFNFKFGNCKNTRISFLFRREYQKTYKLLNKNNDCKYFEQKISIFEKLKRWFKK